MYIEQPCSTFAVLFTVEPRDEREHVEPEYDIDTFAAPDEHHARRQALSFFSRLYEGTEMRARVVDVLRTAS